MIRRLAAITLLLVVLLPSAALAAQPQFSMTEIETELMCPTCQTRLDLSHAPAAEQIRSFVQRKREAGWTKQQVKDALVQDFGPSVLAAPPAAGIGLVAWIVPAALVVGGIGVVVALTLVWRRRRGSQAIAATAVDPVLDDRVDAALAALSDDD
ncbi:MAG: cytochrome c-type biogenesis protein CcmH [Thermoleophilia bacterium]